MPSKQRDNSIGRRKSDNRSSATRPRTRTSSARRRRTSRPRPSSGGDRYPGGRGAGGADVRSAFGKSLDAFDAQLKRMAGAGRRDRGRAVYVYAAGDGGVLLVSARAGEEAWILRAIGV